MNLYIQEQSDDKYFQGQGKYREFFLLVIFAQHAYLCFLSSQVQGINFNFTQYQTIKTLQRVTS